jgi:6-phosphogluconate dehydrogenase
MKTQLRDIGVIGVGAMGGGLARNLASRGFRVAITSRSVASAQQLAAAHPDAELAVFAGIDELARAVARPRVIWMLVPAGEAVDQVLRALEPCLDPGDIVVDAGNSHVEDTRRRASDAAGKPWYFVGMGVSGGARGALEGPSLMPGGDARAWPRLAPICEAIAARHEAEACVAWCGNGAAGHFVKMVHNGIEYGDMQAIAEAAQSLRRGLGFAPAAIAAAFAAWNEAELESFLLDLAAQIFRIPDPENPGALLLDAVLDRAAQNGTGRWAVHAALDLGVAIPGIAAAVDARVLSGDGLLRSLTQGQLHAAPCRRLSGVDLNDVRAALYAARIAAYAQGFALLAAAAPSHGITIALAEVARIWRAGCIIRTRLLGEIRGALWVSNAAALVLAPALRDAIAVRMPAWRRVVAASVTSGFPVPALAASLAWLDTLSAAHGSADLIQAQRDWFGSHGYERRGAPGIWVHSDWEELASGAAITTSIAARSAP